MEVFIISFVENTCLYCGKVFLVPAKEINRGNGKYCSRSCGTSARNHRDNRFFYHKLSNNDYFFHDINLRDGNYIAGLADGEGSFLICLDRLTQRLRASFKVELTLGDKDILEWIWSVFGVGHKYFLPQRDEKSKPAFRFIINDLGNIVSRVIPFFEKFPLQGKKAQDFIRFKTIINNFIKEATSGQRDVARFAKEVAKLNKEYISWDRTGIKILDGNYLAGLTDGEGSFAIRISKDEKMKTGFRIKPVFSIQLSEVDEALLQSVCKTLNCGTVRIDKSRKIADFSVQSLDDIQKYVVPFFNRNKLRAKKKHDFRYFKKIIKMCREKEHLTKKGVRKIYEIREQMNSGGVPNRIKPEFFKGS